MRNETIRFRLRVGTGGVVIAVAVEVAAAGSHGPSVTQGALVPSIQAYEITKHLPGGGPHTHRDGHDGMNLVGGAAAARISSTSTAENVMNGIYFGGHVPPRDYLD